MVFKICFVFGFFKNFIVGNVQFNLSREGVWFGQEEISRSLEY